MKVFKTKGKAYLQITRCIYYGIRLGEDGNVLDSLLHMNAESLRYCLDKDQAYEETNIEFPEKFRKYIKKHAKRNLSIKNAFLREIMAPADKAAIYYILTHPNKLEDEN